MEETIDKFISEIRPFDLMVFKGGDIVSEIIIGLEKKFNKTSPNISHVELAMNKFWIPIIRCDDDRMLSWGSTMSGSLNDGVNDIETNESTFGVQFRDMRLLINNYLKNPKANVGYSRLIYNPIDKKENESDNEYENRIVALKEQMKILYNKYQGILYNSNPLSLIGSVNPKWRKIRDCCMLFSPKILTNWLFCSEFVASIYIDVGVINDATDGHLDGRLLDPKNIVPVDFFGDADNAINMRLCGDIVWIK